MRKRNQILEVIMRTAALALLANMALASPEPFEARRSNPQTSEKNQPTPVTGVSWLQHLGRSFDVTSMGKTGRLGPPELTAEPQSPREMVREMKAASDPQTDEPQAEKTVVRGSDLYRMNCRGCHGENGAGAPPEINSVINPVRATSERAVMERMRSRGMPMSRSDAAMLAAQSRTMLLDRLHHGGQDMPAFPHLSPIEVNSLVAYLRELADVPGAKSEQFAFEEQRERVGEHIAKSTCHICHSAEGTNPTPLQLYNGAIPPLSTLVLRTNRAEFVRKVTEGAPILMGEPRQLLRGRMPVFYYLSAEEAADVYSYLKEYPPQSDVVEMAATSGSATGAGAVPTELEPPQPPASTTSAATTAARESESQTAPAEEQVTILAVLLGLLASMVLCLGFWFSVYELRRLSGDRERAALAVKSRVEGASRLGPELAA